MISLPNGCKCSAITVTPSHWETAPTSIKKTWRIYYRFYDPRFAEPHLVQIKSGINHIKSWGKRKGVVKDIIEEIEYKLKELGYNPITKTFNGDTIEYEIAPETTFIRALEQAKEKLDVSHRVKVDMKSAIKVMRKAALQLRFDVLPIQKVSIRHLTMLLERCKEINPKWSARRHNMYRSYLIMLFKKLSKLEASNGNPARDLDRKKEFRKIKTVLTKEQRILIDKHLLTYAPRFRNFYHLFFHSGGRMTELLQQRPSTVNLKDQKYRSIIKKGVEIREVERTIKNIAVPFWEFFLKDCKEDDFLFGIDFLPANQPMCVDTPGRWWKRLVKDGPYDKDGKLKPVPGLGINVDFNSLRHLNSTEIKNKIGSKKAAMLNGHTSTTMVDTVYDVERESRGHEELKVVDNALA